MKFYKARKEQLCVKCKTYILPGEECVAIRSARTGYLSIFHATPCYIEWNTQFFERNLDTWRAEVLIKEALPAKVKGPRGRPSLYSVEDRAEINRLRTLSMYHTKKHNWSKAIPLAIEIEKIKEKYKDGKDEGSDVPVEDSLPRLQDNNSDGQLQGEETSG